MRRNSSCAADLAKELQTPRAVQSYLLGLIDGDDGLPLEEALRLTITRMGIKEFCKLTKIPMPNVSEFVSGKRNPKPETLDTYLKPFGLRSRLVAVKVA